MLETGGKRAKKTGLGETERMWKGIYNTAAHTRHMKYNANPLTNEGPR